jgi:hypothetical protein
VAGADRDSEPEHDPEKWKPVFRKRSCSNKLAAGLNRSITLSVIDEISGADGDISAFIVQSRRPSNVHPEAETILRGAFRGRSRVCGVNRTFAGAGSPFKKAIEIKDSGGARPFERAGGKGYHFFRHLLENIRTQNASGT